MRKFTKTHNELQWLFPNCNNSNEQSANDFDNYEEMANDLLIAAHNDKEVFTKDDLIDAFMKGASVAQQHNIQNMLLVDESRKLYKKSNEKLVEENKKIHQMISLLTEQLKK